MRKLHYFYALLCLVIITIPQLQAQNTGCYKIDWETDCNGNPFPEGLYVPSDAYDCIGVTINNNHPNPLVLFNSADPTGGDVDLGTPSSNCPTCVSPCPGDSNDPLGGLTNCVPEGLVMITEENPMDANGDGLEDNPDDIVGGDFEICFDDPVTINTASFLDDSKGTITFTHASGPPSTVALTGGLDNDAFTDVFNESDVLCIQIIYTTSGAISVLDFCYDNPNFTCDLVPPVLGIDVEVCAGTDPGPIEILSPASGSGTITYQWQQSLLDCTSSFGAISGATGPTFNPGPLVADTYYKVVVTSDDGNIVCVEESNCVAYSVTNTPSVVLSDPGLLCIADGPVALTASPDNGVFSGTGIVNFNTGVFDPAVAGPGNHTVTYTFSSGSCSGSDQVVIEVSESPETTVTLTNPTCGADNGTITFTFPDNPSRTNIEFSLDGGATYPFDPTDDIGSFTVADLTVGTYDLRVRWGNEECPTDLQIVTLEDQTITACAGITIIRN